MHIMQEISPTGTLSPQHLTYSMINPYTSVPRNNLGHPEEFPMRKQGQCIQVYYIITVLKTFINQ